jgi:hypothetical protein
MDFPKLIGTRLTQMKKATAPEIIATTGLGQREADLRRTKIAVLRVLLRPETLHNQEAQTYLRLSLRRSLAVPRGSARVDFAIAVSNEN